MITFFTHCRPFEDEFEEIQLTAISSWLSMGDNQVVLVGEHGLAGIGYDRDRRTGRDRRGVCCWIYCNRRVRFP